MIRLRQIKVLVSDNEINSLIKKCAKKLNIKTNDISQLKIIKQSIDARHKPEIYHVYEIDLKINNEDEILKRYQSVDIFKAPNEEYTYSITGTNKINNRIIIVGSGPAGLFAAYMLAINGYKPLIIERGNAVDERVNDVEEFWKTGILNTKSNVQFGEGGAGTFSDGKLNTLVKDNMYRGKKAFEIFIQNGADESILYTNKPHIGTDKLRDIVKNMRNKIISNGGEFRYNTCMTSINIKDNKTDSIIVNDDEEIKCDVLILAIGHSARDTFKMLYDKLLIMEPKPFAVGVRIQHDQEMINNAEYGVDYDAILGNASYKLTHTCSNKRGVYTFCMCPGGYVVNASSEDNRLAINGMSYSSRDSENANSAIIVTISPNDFGTNPLDGIEYQRKLEEKAYELGNGNIPIQLYKDFKNNVESTGLGNIKPIFKGNYKLCNLNLLFPNYINESLKEGIENFNNKIKGYATGDAILAGVESRTSSPVRIVRDDNMESNIRGIYPIGEGAGYAGGITSAAIDGIKVFEKIISIYKNKEL